MITSFFSLKRAFVFTTFLFVLVAATNSSAQKNSFVIKGHVITPDGSPAFATVELKGAKKKTETDNNGAFTIAFVSPVNDTLIISSVALETYQKQIVANRGETINLGNIYLSYKAAELQNVEVKGRTAKSYKSDYSFLGTKTQTSVIDIPQSISSITKEMIQDRMDYTLKDAVDAASGVEQYSGYDEYTIRGFRAENARMINGLRGYNTTYTSNMLANVERVEVIKGPAATLYGNCDPGGTINLVTKKPLEEAEKEISMAAGTWNHYRAEADVTGPINKKKTLLYRFNGGYDNTHSFRDLWYGKSYQIAPSFSFVPNDKIQLNVDISLSHVNTILDRGVPGFQNGSLNSTPIHLTASQPGDYLHETTLAGNVLFSYNINKNITFNSGYLAYLTQQNVAEHGVQSYITDDSVNLYFSKWKYHTLTNTLTNYFTFHFNTGKISHQLLAGYDFIESDVNLTQNYFERPDLFGYGSGIVGIFSLRHPQYISADVKDYQLSNYNSSASNVDGNIFSTQGIYVQEQMSYKKFKLLLGLRQELYTSGDDDDTSGVTKINKLLPRVGLVYELKHNASLYFTYNRGFDPFEASSSKQVFDAPFKPITSQLLEIGAKTNLLANKLYASLAVYQLVLYNVAVNAADISNPDLYVQQGKDRSRGIEIEVAGSLLPNLSIDANYSYCVATVLESKIASQVGMVMENAPKNSSSSWIKYTFVKGALKGFGIAAGHSQVSVRNTLQQGLQLPGYIVMNGSFQYTWNKLKLALNVNNVTNTAYWQAAYNNVSKWAGAPRNLMLQIGYRF